MGTQSPPPDHVLQREIAQWLKHFREQWFQKLPSALDARRRFLYALAGTLTWALSAVPTAFLTNPGLSEAYTVVLLANPTVFFTIITGYCSFLAFLISYTPRKSAPIRFFIDGVVFPILIVFIIQTPFPEPTSTPEPVLPIPIMPELSAEPEP